MELLGQVAAIEELRCTAIFEDREIRAARHRLAHLDGALIRLIGSAQGLMDRSDALRVAVGSTTSENAGAIVRAVRSIKAWQAGTIDAGGLGRHLAQAKSDMTAAPQLRAPPSSERHEITRPLASSGRVEHFLAALVAYADAEQALTLGCDRSAPASQQGMARPNDFTTAALTGLRAVLAVVLASLFWILADWPHGSTATVLAAVATARLGTTGHAVPLAMATALIFSLAVFPAFVVVDVVLPLASGFPMFALAVAPMLFLCAPYGQPQNDDHRLHVGVVVCLGWSLSEPDGLRSNRAREHGDRGSVRRQPCHGALGRVVA